MSSIYKNRWIINQRGGSIDIDNTTEREKFKISHRSGSNVNFTNVVNSELATNNKQVNVIHDLFQTVGNDKTESIGKNYTLRTGENLYILKGFKDTTQLEAVKNWKSTYAPIASKNSQFKIKRGGSGYPNGEATPQSGTPSSNPVIGSQTITVENSFSGYTGVPIRDSTQDQVATYAKVPSSGNTTPAESRSITLNDVGGLATNPSTEGGSWETNTTATNLGADINAIQSQLTPIEQQMGHGGDETYFTKRNKFEQVGTEFNDYPSVRIDEIGRSQPTEMVVSITGAYKNHTATPYIEEIDNSSNFPGGNDDKLVGNRYSRTVGSGGIHLKSTGGTELGGTVLKGGFKRIHLNASHGIQIASESFIELQSLKSITIRTSKQVYVEGALGVNGNVIIGGGAYVEGELYCHHITAPAEVHQTEDTIVYGKFNTRTSRSLPIGEVFIDKTWKTVYALNHDDLILNYSHSHHHNGIPMRLITANQGVRQVATSENINVSGTVSQALAQEHSKQTAEVIG